MMNKNMVRALEALVLGSLLSMPVMAAGEPLRPSGSTDSGVQLNMTRQQLERQRVAQRMAEGWDKSKVEETAPAEEKPEGAVRFVLKKVEIPKSEVLKPEEISQIVKKYQGREVSLDDLYALVGDINALYQKKGFITCRAYLAPQTIHEGTVHIGLIEGKNGTLSMVGRNSTNESYIKDRLHIKEGDIQDMNRLNADLLRFNATNDAQLRILLKSGEKTGTTDYVIAVKEPQKQIAGVFSDNAGSDTSGLYRVGAYWQDRDVMGNRDHFFLSGVRSEGMKAISASYNTPVNTIGTRAGISYTTNSVNVVDGPFESLGVKGHAYALTAYMVSPIITSEHMKSEWGIEYGHQRSKTDFGTKTPMRMHWTDDRIDSFLFYYDQLDFGRSSAFYQKHGYRTGWYKNLYEDNSTFGKYELNMVYQKAYESGQDWTIRLDGQISSTNYLPSAEMFYLGGMYSVRGYKESLIGGDGGFAASAEYNFPLEKSHRLKGYLFLDGGRVWGKSAYDDRNLVGAGFGLKSQINDHISLNVALAFPLIRTINDQEQGRTRIHFSLSSAF